MTEAPVAEAASAPKRRIESIRYYDYSPMRPGRAVASAGQLSDPADVGYALAGIKPMALSYVVRSSLAPSIVVDAAREVTQQMVAQVEGSLRDLLESLLDDWLKESRHQSSMRRAGKHLNFQLVRKVGPLATELIAQRMISDPNPLWIWALRELTGEDPARGAQTVSDATISWQEWVREQGFV